MLKDLYNLSNRKKKRDLENVIKSGLSDFMFLSCHVRVSE